MTIKQPPCTHAPTYTCPECTYFGGGISLADMRIAAAERSPCTEERQCNECDSCNPIISPDVDICRECREHASFRENTGSECCGADAY